MRRALSAQVFCVLAKPVSRHVVTYAVTRAWRSSIWSPGTVNHAPGDLAADPVVHTPLPPRPRPIVACGEGLRRHDDPLDRPVSTSPSRSRSRSGTPRTSGRPATTWSSASRSTTGQVGYGEGVPRAVRHGRDDRVDLRGARRVRRRPRTSAGPRTSPRSSGGSKRSTLPETEADPRGMAGNAARCALELALLDAYGRRFGESVGEAVRLVESPACDAPRPPDAGSATAGRSRPRSRPEGADLGLEDAALRLRPGQGQGRRRRPGRPGAAGRGSGGSSGRRMDLRLDANEAWPAAELARPGPRRSCRSAPRPWSSRSRTPRSTPWPSSGRGWACR